MATKTARIPRSPESIDWSDRVSSILSSNAKLEKTPAGGGAIVCGISMAPARRSGVVNVCQHATRACIAACVLWFAGRTVTATVRAAAVARTMLWYFHPAVFYSRLRRELSAFAARCDRDGVRGFVRLNTASDIDHVTTDTSNGAPAVFTPADFPSLTMYDYTKDSARVARYLSGEFPPNYHLSLSIHEESTAADVLPILERGGNVVVVVDSYYWGPSRRYGTLPASVAFVGPDGRRVVVPAVDGDIADVRTPEFDGRGVAVCLRLKSQSTAVKAKARLSGFARPWSLGGKEHSQRFEFPAARGTMVVRLK